MNVIEVDYVEVDEYNELIKVIEEAEEANRGKQAIAQSALFQEERQDVALNVGNGHAEDRVVELSQRFALPDLEDIGLICNRLLRHRRTGLKVTDISSSEWCQQQVAFSLSAKLPKEVTQTAAMVAGSNLHAGLEAETSVAVEVNVETMEDAWAVRIINMICSIHQLLGTGLTREMWMFGSLEGRWMRGIIDQIELDADGRALIVEHKTRRNPSLPSAPQKLTAQLQAMIYRNMFEGLAAFLSGPQASAMLSMMQLDAYKELSGQVVEHSRAMGLEDASTLAKLLPYLQNAAKALPPASSTVAVRYIWQGDGELLGVDEVLHDETFLKERLLKHVGFWVGTQPPQQVPEDERWKCRHCIFQNKCQRQG